MPPTRCPARLRRLIAQANEKPIDPSHPLRLILRALQFKRQNKGPDTFAVDLISTVTVNLIDYSITVRNELARALEEIDPPTRIHLIRECQVCSQLFWAGRVDKTVCDKHAEQWRKSRQRIRERADKARAEKEATERQIRNELKAMSRTAVAFLNAIVFGNERVYWKIDNAAYWELKDNPLVRRVPNDRVIRRTLAMLVARGYLRHVPHGDPTEDYYVPLKKLLDHWGKQP